jgi:hypothetical protein
MEKLYISGPMTGILNFNYDAFAEAARTLRGLGLFVNNPAETFAHEPEEIRASRSWGFYMAVAINLLRECDSIVMLPGWSNSNGARKELMLAISNNMRVYYYLGTNWYGQRNDGAVKYTPLMEMI